MEVKEIRALTGLIQNDFAKKYGIPLHTLANWEQGIRKPPGYVLELLEFKVKEDLLMEELRKFVESEIKKTEKLLKDKEQEREENRNNQMFDNEASITCLISMLTAYRNVLDKISVTD